MVTLFSGWGGDVVGHPPRKHPQPQAILDSLWGVEGLLYYKVGPWRHKQYVFASPPQNPRGKKAHKHFLCFHVGLRRLWRVSSLDVWGLVRYEAGKSITALYILPHWSARTPHGHTALISTDEWLVCHGFIDDGFIMWY